jgi:hypothetical protein
MAPRYVKKILEFSQKEKSAEMSKKCPNYPLFPYCRLVVSVRNGPEESWKQYSNTEVVEVREGESTSGYINIQTHGHSRIHLGWPSFTYLTFSLSYLSYLALAEISNLIFHPYSSIIRSAA